MNTESKPMTERRGGRRAVLDRLNRAAFKSKFLLVTLVCAGPAYGGEEQPPSRTLYNTGSENNGFGAQALFNNLTGVGNNAFGVQALFSNTTGFNNTAFGALVLRNLESGDVNTAFGTNAGISLAHGSGNVYIGAG